MEVKSTTQPSDAAIQFSHDQRRLSLAERAALSNDLMQGTNAALGGREPLENNLRAWLQMYEMVPPELENEPWPESSNITLPIIPTQIESMLAYIVSKVLVPRLIIVTGNNPQAQQVAYQAERYYAVELVKQRGRTTWYEELGHWIHLGLRDGVGYLEAPWRRLKIKRKITQMTPRVIDGVPIVDPETGQPIQDPVEHEIEMTKYDDVMWLARQLKDVILLPSSAPSVEEAAAVAVVEWIYEDQFSAMLADSEERGVGEFYEDAIEDALSYIEDGTSDDIASDRQGDYDKTEGGQINTGNAQGSHTSKFFKLRGPVKVFRWHSRQYDMDKDGIAEENIFYYHDRIQRMLGWMPYEYMVGERPIFEFSPNPRPTEAIGFSTIQRLGPMSAEISKQYNDRNNAVDIKMSPPKIIKDGTKLLTNDMMYGPGVTWEGEEGSISFPVMPDIPVASFQQEAETKQYITELTGMNAPAIGAQSSGRRTATENRIQAASTSTRNDLIVMRFRVALRALINFTHRLKLQYLPEAPLTGSDNSGPFTMPKEVLAQDLRIDVSGASDPLDAATRLSQDVGIYQALSTNPLVASNVVHLYYLTRKLLEDAGTQNIEQIIGTAEEAQQLQQAQQQAAQQQAAMGAPPQQGHPQPHAQKPANGAAKAAAPHL